MSGAITFSEIPPNLRVPLFYAEFSNSGAGTSHPVQRALIIGQTATAQPEVPTYVSSVMAAQASYGANSELANMVAAYRANDPVGELWVLPLADASESTAATGTVALTGTASANGTLFLYVGGSATTLGDLVQVGVTSGQTAAEIATATVAAVNAITTLPVTATAASGTVTLTADNKGTLGNDIPVTLNYLGAQGGQSTPAGVTVTITAMAGGATDPVLTGAALATAFGNTPFDFIVNPYSAQTAATTAVLSDAAGRWNYASQIYGHAFSAVRNTVADLPADADENDQHLTMLGVNGNACTGAWLWGAAFVGALAPSIKAQPNRPVQFLAVAGVRPEQATQEIGFANQQALLSAGVALCARVDPSGGVQILRAVTTYLTNSAGTADSSYLDTETLFTLMAVVRALKAAVTQKFPRALLADDGTPLAPTPPGDTPTIVTPTIIRNELIVQYGLLCSANLCQDLATFAAGLIVQRNANDNNRVDVLFDPYLVSGLRIFAMLTEFFFQAQQAPAA